jgi:serine/threonine protein kinase
VCLPLWTLSQAPEVLKNPSVPFQESKSVDLAMLSARGVKPYGPPVDMWAAGVLAYELVCGRCGLLRRLPCRSGC